MFRDFRSHCPQRLEPAPSGLRRCVILYVVDVSAETVDSIFITLSKSKGKVSFEILQRSRRGKISTLANVLLCTPYNKGSSLVNEIKQYQEKWLQHVQRMDTNRILKQALQYKPKGRRNIGRPRKRWRDQFHFEDQGTRNTPNPS